MGVNTRVSLCAWVGLDYYPICASLHSGGDRHVPPLVLMGS
jgi:hypothetical protein